MIRNLVSAATLLIVALLCRPLTAADARKPNVIMIISDDQGWMDYGFMGHEQLSTPHLDRLAKQGLTFTRGYVPNSLCCPSLASVITGLYPHQHKITSNDPPIPHGMSGDKFNASDAFKKGRERMNAHMDAVPTLPKLLVKNGYLAFQTGKWWQGSYEHGGFTHGMTKGSRHGDAGLDIGRKTMKPIYDFIEEARKQDKPFFVWYAPMMPHEPHTPPKELVEKYAKLTKSRPLARYWAMVEWFDLTCGDLLKYLDEHDLAENTVVTYFADNGWIQLPDKSGHTANSKYSPYDGGLRTPIIVRYPAALKPKMSDVPVTSLDLFPTILKLAGISPPSKVEGIDLTDADRVAAPRTIQGELYTHNSLDLDNPAKSLRWRWMLKDGMKILVPTELEKGARVELYDVVHDPHETKDLSAEKPELVQSLRKSLDAWWTP